ncbi:predicted protein [Sclerotinia sclerotiorum 1980 UF-70]|uniref:Uncharacterized protein n=1 Tax=Sclerotinia sclerotiorum (strain ATCC 18683 / 1980 / Ss-1) TaxID=665079 RepID=A7F6Y8_SCLS1|nr:predicted protein [Sclerotinia sclerotiorum 1980 UF-70]EDN98509.1 predicted protein [Sclerotinia sclerotiorum 1980 UF-70]
MGIHARCQRIKRADCALRNKSCQRSMRDAAQCVIV